MVNLTLTDKSFKGVVKTILKGLASKALISTSDNIMEDFIESLINKSSNYVNMIINFLNDSRDAK